MFIFIGYGTNRNRNEMFVVCCCFLMNLVVDIEKRSVPCLFNDNERRNDKKVDWMNFDPNV